MFLLKLELLHLKVCKLHTSQSVTVTVTVSNLIKLLNFMCNFKNLKVNELQTDFLVSTYSSKTKNYKTKMNLIVNVTNNIIVVWEQNRNDCHSSTIDLHSFFEYVVRIQY